MKPVILPPEVAIGALGRIQVIFETTRETPLKKYLNLKLNNFRNCLDLTKTTN
jgi:hypothetical protein